MREKEESRGRTLLAGCLKPPCFALLEEIIVAGDVGGDVHGESLGVGKIVYVGLRVEIRLVAVTEYL
jgi:hypothetical protein